jgi:hypothetical protein
MLTYIYHSKNTDNINRHHMQEKLLFFVLRSMSVYNFVQDWTITEYPQVSQSIAFHEVERLLSSDLSIFETSLAPDRRLTTCLDPTTQINS